MRQRIFAYLLVLLTLVGLLYGYGWYKHRDAAERARKMLADLTGEYEALDSLGDIELDPSGLTLATLQERLHQPARTLPGAQNTTRVGWACAGKDCAIWTFFLTPPGRELYPTAVPAALSVRDSRQIRPHRITVGGVRLGESIEDIKQFCKNRGYGVEIGPNQVTWDKHWKIVYVGIGGTADFLVFANQDMMKSYLNP